MALEHDLIQKSGSFFSYGETRLGQGRNNTKEFLRDNPELAAELEEKIHAKLGIGEDAEAKPEAANGDDPAKAENGADPAKADAPVKPVPDAKAEESKPAKKPEAKKPEKKAA
jgi:recombination protein RecA